MTIDLTAIGSLISSIGFPIVMCLILVYFMNVTNTKLTDAINGLQNVITELIAKEEAYHDKKDGDE